MSETRFRLFVVESVAEAGDGLRLVWEFREPVSLSWVDVTADGRRAPQSTRLRVRQANGTRSASMGLEELRASLVRLGPLGAVRLDIEGHSLLWPVVVGLTVGLHVSLRKLGSHPPLPVTPAMRVQATRRSSPPQPAEVAAISWSQTQWKDAK